jgi:hypothetical protein
MVDVFVNGVKFVNGTDFTATDGTTVALAAGLAAGNIVEIDNLLTAYLPTNALRTITTFTATAAQTTFSVSYTQGLIDVFYNGSNLAQSEYTATNGTSIILATACQLNDIVVVYAYSYSVGAYSGIGGSGTSGYLSKFTGTNTIGNSIISDNGTTASILGKLSVTNTYALDPLISLATTTSGNVEVQLRTATTTYNAGIGVVTSGYDFGLFTSNTTRMTITSAGVVDLPYGQIKFPATQNPSSDANTLDDYEEGLLTVSITCTSGTVTLDGGYNSLGYVKIGSMVFVTGLLYVNSVSSPTGIFSFPLPFTCANLGDSAGTVAATIYIDNAVSANTSDFCGIIDEATTQCNVYLGNTNTLSSGAAAQLKSTSAIYLSLTYRAS